MKSLIISILPFGHNSVLKLMLVNYVNFKTRWPKCYKLVV